MNRLSFNILSTGLIAILVMSSFFVHGQFRTNRNQEAQAESLMGNGDFEGALAVYDQLAKQIKEANGDPIAILNKRAYCLYSLGRNEEALADINRYLENFDDNQSTVLRSYIYGALGNTDAQLKDIGTLLAHNPDDTQMLRLRASVLMETSRYAEAQRDIKKVVALDPSAEVKAYLGLSYYYLENTDSAFVIFNDVIASNPEYAATYLYAGSLALETGNNDLALRYINSGLKMDPSNTTLLFYKGVALVQSEKTTEGCRCLTKAFAAGEDDAADYLKQYCYGVE